MNNYLITISKMKEVETETSLTLVPCATFKQSLQADNVIVAEEAAMEMFGYLLDKGWSIMVSYDR